QKRRGEAEDSGRAQKWSRLLAPSTGGASEPEPVDFEENGTLSFEFGKDRICFWRAGVQSNVCICQSLGPLVGRKGNQNQEYPLLSIPVDDSVALLASDDDEELRNNDGYVTDKVSLQSLISDRLHVLFGSVLSSAWPAGTIRCPVCMDFYPQIVQSGRLILSTLCGHVFCSQCLPFALQSASFCPTCRTDLTPGQYHPIYI
ncbi:RNF4 ligase, partial [Chloropsis hardwickii]|nr:RNF4 ligase [Chloropsis hardwickii]